MEDLKRTVEVVEQRMKELCTMVPSKEEEFTLKDSRYMYTVSRVYDLYLEMEEHQDNPKVVVENGNMIINTVELFKEDLNGDEP